MPHKKFVGPLLMGLLLSASCLAGVLRTDETFEITLPAGQTFTIKVEFRLGYTSEKKVNSADFSVENHSESGEITVTRARIVRSGDHATLRGDNLELAVAPGREIDKHKVLNREKLDEYYWQVVTELSINFGGVTKFFIFRTTKMDKEIIMQDRPF